MAKIFINSRDELLIIESGNVAVVKANGNYSSVYYINKREILVSVPIGRLETMLKAHNNREDKFVKLGRSFIINARYVHRIDLPRQLLSLTDPKNPAQDLVIKMGKGLLKPFKEGLLANAKSKVKPKLNQTKETEE